MHPLPEVIESLRRAVEAMPDDLPLRLHLARLLVASGQRDEAVRHVGAILQRDPANAGALALLTGAGAADRNRPAVDLSRGPGQGQTESLPRGQDDEVRSGRRAVENPKPDGFDWSRAESEVSDLVPPMFVGGGPAGASDSVAAGDPASRAFDVEPARLTLADVAGMTEVKQRLEAAFLAPMRNPELRRLYGKSLRGGLLLYGPPGCGKTFIARAVAGELGDLLFTVVNLGRHLGVDAEMALRGCNLRFRQRFRQMEHASPRPLEELSPSELEALWEEAKIKLADAETRGHERVLNHSTQAASQARS